MKFGPVVAVLGLALSACQPTQTKVLIGGNAVVQAAQPLLPDSIIVVVGSRIRVVGTRSDVPVPQDSERVDVTGKFIAAAEGNRLAAGETASLEIREGSPGGPVVRRMRAGQWE